MSRTRGKALDGFTLIEVLVAFAIAALLIVPLMRLVSAGLGSFERAQNYATATLWAQSIIANAGVQTPLAEGVQTGDLPLGMRWEMDVEPYHDDLMSTARLTSGFVPYTISLTISWPDHRTRNVLRFATLRLAPPPRTP
jgi:general secretion pathway protein I